MPRIVENPVVTKAQVVAPRAPQPVRAGKIRNAEVSVPKGWLPPEEVERKWTAIVIHHSGTDTGNSAIFDRSHREERQWDGVGYDFVIGNGTNSADGQVEVTFRWRQQRTGAHCKTPENWANEEAIGICLVGNFNQSTATAAQMRSVARLVRFLQGRYGIDSARIYGHNNTPGARATDCPGRYFEMSKLRSMLGK
ncbi:MAG: N-acetylmuramoyl-L-alanine amidase [Sedimentisphaerales bacterium]|nr:N-acetylmuramoyl-L-alanine amidase [Sedimentisphaerales bacterium]